MAKKGKKSYFEMKEIQDMQSHYNNTQGMLICHSMNRERGSKKEIHDLMSQFVDIQTEVKKQEEISTELDDIDIALAHEVELLKKKQFIYDTGVNCMMFTKTPYDPIRAVKEMFDGAKAEGIIIKETQKIFPLQKVSIANTMEKLIQTVKDALELIDQTSFKTFAIRYSCRHNSNYTRDETIKTIADIMPKEWKVDLKNPDVTLFIEIFYRGLGVSFIDKQTLTTYKNFNIGKYLHDEE